jgi:DNA-binding transcriptional LysR family regulator
LVDEGLDLGVRIGQLPDSSLRAVLVGQVRRVICAAPQYIARYGVPATPRDLANHSVVACTAVTPIPDRWSFHRPNGVTSVAVTPRLVVNTTAAAVDAALDGFGLACILSYQAEPHTATGLLQTVLVEYEPPPHPSTSCIRRAGTCRPRSACFSTTPPERFAPNSGEDNLIAVAVENILTVLDGKPIRDKIVNKEVLD